MPPEPLTLEFEGCRVLLWDDCTYTETVFPDGTKCPALPNGSAEQAVSLHAAARLGPVQAIICGLPFASLLPSVQDGVVEALDQMMQPGATFRTFQYVHAYGLPTAIAAKLRHPERTVVCFAGDGCFMMYPQELATAVQYDAAVLVIVVNNGMLGTIRMHQEREFPGRPGFAEHLAEPARQGVRDEQHTGDRAGEQAPGVSVRLVGPVETLQRLSQAMERAAVLDDYFEDIQVEAVKPGDGWRRIRDLPQLFPALPSAPG